MTAASTSSPSLTDATSRFNCLSTSADNSSADIFIPERWKDFVRFEPIQRLNLEAAFGSSTCNLLFAARPTLTEPFLSM